MAQNGCGRLRVLLNICSRKFPPGYFAPRMRKLAPQTYDRSLSFPPTGISGAVLFWQITDRIGR